MTKRPDELAPFAPAGQRVLLDSEPAQLALDGTPMEPQPLGELLQVMAAAKPPEPSPAQCVLPLEPSMSWAEAEAAMAAAAPPRPRQMALDPFTPETPAARKKRKALEAKRKRRAQLAADRKRVLEQRPIARRQRVTMRRCAAKNGRAMTGLRSICKSGLAARKALAELPPQLRALLHLAAAGQAVDEETGELVDRMGLDASRARNIVGLVWFLYVLSVPEGRGRVVYGINGDYLRHAMPANPQTGEPYAYSTLMNQLHRGETPEEERWRDGTTGYLCAAEQTGAIKYHQPRRPGDGRAPHTIPESQRGPDVLTLSGERLPGYAFTQWRFEEECIRWPDSRPPKAELDRAELDGRARAHGFASYDEACAHVASRAPPD